MWCLYCTSTKIIPRSYEHGVLRPKLSVCCFQEHKVFESKWIWRLPKDVVLISASVFRKLNNTLTVLHNIEESTSQQMSILKACEYLHDLLQCYLTIELPGLLLWKCMMHLAPFSDMLTSYYQHFFLVFNSQNTY